MKRFRKEIILMILYMLLAVAATIILFKSFV